MIQQKAQVNGFIRALANQTHPLQTNLLLILTDFEPNKNNQGIPITEAENILNTALHTPLKINFDGAEFYGHTSASPIGPITRVYKGIDNGRDVIFAEAVVWNDLYEDISDHLKLAFAEGIGTSWEIYYKDSVTENNVQWLQGCVFAGTCVVKTPAYGPNRTRLLAVAEKLNERAKERLNMANEPIVGDSSSEEEEEVITPDVDITTEVVSEDTSTENSAEAANNVDELRNDISNVMGILSNMYEGLYSMLDDTYEIEQQLATTDMPSMAEQLQKLLAGITKTFDTLKNKASTAETALAEYQAKTEEARALAELTELRKEALAEVGIELADKAEFYLGMSAEFFNEYIGDLRLVKGNKANAEKKLPKIPEPINSDTKTINIQELAAVIRSSK